MNSAWGRLVVGCDPSALSYNLRNHVWSGREGRRHLLGRENGLKTGAEFLNVCIKF